MARGPEWLWAGGSPCVTSMANGKEKCSSTVPLPARLTLLLPGLHPPALGWRESCLEQEMFFQIVPCIRSVLIHSEGGGFPSSRSLLSVSSSFLIANLRNAFGQLWGGVRVGECRAWRRSWAGEPAGELCGASTLNPFTAGSVAGSACIGRAGVAC